MQVEKKHKLVAIDGNSLLYRAFFAMRYLSTSDGQPTNAVYGFILMLLRLLEEEKPDSIVVAWDTPVKTFRHIEYEQYKAQRKPTPDELRSQAPIIRDVVKAFRIPMIEVEGYEADDVVATVAQQASREGYDTLIVTGDLDALQNVNEHVHVLTTVKGVTDTVIYDPQAVEARFGIPPSAMADFKALKGDASDNIEGVRGIGDKTAAKLIRQFGNIENMLDNLDQVETRKIRDTLDDSRDKIVQNKFLTKLVVDTPIDFHVRDCKAQEPDWDRLRELFIQLEFKTLLKRLPESEQPVQEMPEAEPLGCHTVISSDAELAKLLELLQGAQTFSIHPQVTHQKPAEADLIGISFSMGSGETYYVPTKNGQDSSTGALDFGGETFYAVNPSFFAEVLSDPSKNILGHDLKICCGVLKARGVNIPDSLFDTMIGAYVLNPSRTSYKLPDIVLEYLGLELPRIDPKAKEEQSLTQEAVICAEAEAIYRLAPELKFRLEADDLGYLFNHIEMPLVPILAEIELHGVAVNPAVLSELSKTLEGRIAGLEEEIYDLAEMEFNIGSPKQLQEVLYDKLGIPATKKTKTGFSTDADTLAQLAPMYPIVDKILLYRELTKLKSTYVDALPKLINPRTGKIHTSLNQAVTSTGRLSSTDPNLQNIPIRTEIGRQIRKAFIASNNNLLISADYSQIELRILAHVSRDSNLMEAFRKNEDIHIATACTLFGVTPELVSPEMRSQAKTVNYAVIYGMSDYGLARELQISPGMAHEYITNYFAKLPGVQKYIDDTLKFARDNGYVATLLGRRRYIPEINASNRNYRMNAERAAVNMPIQGTEADIMKLAMIRIHDQLTKLKVQTQMVLQVHDELVFEVPHDELNQIAPIIREAMENAYPLDVPITVDVKAGDNWYATEVVNITGQSPEDQQTLF